MRWHNLGTDLTPNWYASDPQQVTQTIVRLHQCANPVGHSVFDHDPGTCAGAAFELMADHAGATANITLGDRATTLGRVEGGKGMLLCQWKALNVAQPAIISFCD